MKRLFPAFFITSLAMCVSIALAHAAATYNDTVSGAQTASPETDGAALNLNATGDLPGMLNIKLKHEAGGVTSGTWTMTVLPQTADANSSETGTLTGAVTGGTMTLDANGIVNAVNSIQLTVQSGTGQYQTITSGNGTLSLSADPENATKLGGPLVLNF
jgi:hypothetical protein